MKNSNPDSSRKNGRRKALVNPTEQRERLGALAVQLKEGTPLNAAQMTYLADVFEKISQGEKADDALHLSRTKGQRKLDEQSRQKISLVFSMVASLIAPADGQFSGEGLTLIAALERTSPLVKELFGVEESDRYSVEYLKNLWYDPSYAHMRNPFRSSFEPDFPEQLRLK